MIRLGRAMLPEDAEARRVALRDYFGDKEARAVPSRDGWDVTLQWPEGRDRHVDPKLDIGLEWWGHGVQRTTMPLARRRERGRLSALYDTWTLLSWSEWFTRTDMARMRDLVVLHVDDHYDLGAPRLRVADDGWFDLITGAPVRMSDPDTVNSAIESGAITMGSFVTPFLHAVPHTQVRHLRQPPKTTRTVRSRIRLHTVEDTLLSPGAPRPAVRLEEEAGARGPGTYLITADVDEWLADIDPEATILIHFDLDYFNNRFDGDSDWELFPPRLDPSPAEIATKFLDVMRGLRALPSPANVGDVVVAYSPGFFPSELWPLLDEMLNKSLPV